MDIQSSDDRQSSIRKSSGMDEESPNDQRDIFERMLLLDMREKKERDVTEHAQTQRRHNKRTNFRKILNSSSSNDRLIPHEPNPDTSRQNSERARNVFQTENSMDEQSFRKSFKKKIQESFSVENTIRDSSSELSNMSESHSLNQILPKEYREEEEMVEVLEKKAGCNCKRSKCLKLYCECFQNKKFCTQNCRCYDCGNKSQNIEQHKKAVIQALARNAHGFEDQKCGPSVQESAKGFSLGVQIEQVKKGCKCRKTHCMKKYCECYYNGNVCGIFCRCEDCFNTNYHQSKGEER